MRELHAADPAVARLIERELARQSGDVELIASENFTDPAVMQATGSILTNKYAEGYPGKRYYGGCAEHDVLENLAIQRAKTLFDASHANVQPHSGSSANLAAYLALIDPGDTMLAMRLDHGGHLTHGAKVNFSGRLFHVVPYGVRRDTECIDYDEVERLARQHMPKLIVAGASAYPRVIDFARFAQIARAVQAKLLVDMAHIAGLVAAGTHPSPVPHADVVTTTTHKTLRGPRGGLILCKQEWARAVDKQVFPGCQGGPLMHVVGAKAVCFHLAASEDFRRYQRQVACNAQALAEALRRQGFRLVSGGTDNHLLLVDVTPQGVNGQQAEDALSRVGIVVNKNKIPFDPLSARAPSGIRLGTPAVTTRGMGVQEMEVIAACIAEAIARRDQSKGLSTIQERVRRLTARFPLYPQLQATHVSGSEPVESWGA
ncbi:MAG: serine hydroxymethyltransferase [Myxococcota bacterium]